MRKQKIAINFLKVIDSSIKINDFKIFNIKIYSVIINESQILKRIITFLKSPFTSIHKHFNRFNNKTLIELNDKDNLLSISVKIINLYTQYEKLFE
jgi:hypothetical protein